MKQVCSLERMVLDVLKNKKVPFDEIQKKSGLSENMTFNVLQALCIQDIVKNEGANYFQSPHFVEEENKESEALELIEAVIETRDKNLFKFQKIAISPKDEKIFLAMLRNLEDFLKGSHLKAQREIPLSKRKVIFWGIGQMDSLINNIYEGDLL